MEPYPVPSPVAVQMSRGPPAGHSFSSPVSLDMRVLSGPYHCGQSTATACTARALAASIVKRNPIIRQILFRAAGVLLRAFTYQHNAPTGHDLNDSCSRRIRKVTRPINRIRNKIASASVARVFLRCRTGASAGPEGLQRTRVLRLVCCDTRGLGSLRITSS
jgi:hypothetical protein